MVASTLPAKRKTTSRLESVDSLKLVAPCPLVGWVVTTKCKTTIVPTSVRWSGAVNTAPEIRNGSSRFTRPRRSLKNW